MLGTKAPSQQHAHYVPTTHNAHPIEYVYTSRQACQAVQLHGRCNTDKKRTKTVHWRHNKAWCTDLQLAGTAHPIHCHTHLHLVGILPTHSTSQPSSWGKKKTLHTIHCGGSLPTLQMTAHHNMALLPTVPTLYIATNPKPQTAHNPGPNAEAPTQPPHTVGKRSRGPSPGSTVYNTPLPCHLASNACCDRTGLRPLSQDKGTPESTLMSP